MSRPVEGSPPGDVVLEGRGLTHYFRVGGGFFPSRLRALCDVSITLRRGYILALVGESGSGKSTVAKVLARLVAPTSGQVLLDGVDVLRTEPRRASLRFRGRVQMIFQDPYASLNPAHSVGYHLERPLVRHQKATDAAARRLRVHSLLREVGLEPPETIASQWPAELSGGQRQRVAIARTLAVEPDVLLADEPTSMLDVSIRAGVLNLMRRLRDGRGVAILYVTHDIASARYVSDAIAVMYAGQIVEQADGETLVSEPAHPYTRLLLAAVPDANQDPLPLPAIRRGAPSLVDPPAGCAFAPRCPEAVERCRTHVPEVTEVGLGHLVRCHRVHEGGWQSGEVPDQS